MAIILNDLVLAMTIMLAHFGLERGAKFAHGAAGISRTAPNGSVFAGVTWLVSNF